MKVSVIKLNWNGEFDLEDYISGNFAYQKLARTKYPTFFGDASLATDGNYATCLETRMVRNE
jgi:hypothetical protein